MHLEIAPYSVRTLFRHVFLISAQSVSAQYCSQGCASIVLDVSIYRAGLAGLAAGRAAAVVRIINF